MPKFTGQHASAKGKGKRPTFARIYYCKACNKRHEPPTGRRCPFATEEDTRRFSQEDKSAEEREDSPPPFPLTQPDPPGTPDLFDGGNDAQSISSLLEDAQNDHDLLKTSEKTDYQTASSSKSPIIPSPTRSPGNAGFDMQQLLDGLSEQFNANQRQILAAIQLGSGKRSRSHHADFLDPDERDSPPIVAEAT